MPDVELPAATKRACTSCGYDLSGAAPGGAGTCPECGYTPTAEEIALGERRAVFVELTRWRQWGVYAWLVGPLVLFAFLEYPFGPWVVFIIVSIVMALAIAGTEVAGRVFIKPPRGQKLASQAVWRLSTKWLLMPFWGAGLAFFLIMYIEQRLFPGTESVIVRAPVIVAAIAYLVAWRVWRWSWRRLSRTAGLTADLQDGAIAGTASRKVMWVFGVILALPVLSLIIELLLDWLRPEWWR